MDAEIWCPRPELNSYYMVVLREELTLSTGAPAEAFG